MTRTISKVVFWITVISAIFSFFYALIGEGIPVEFVNPENSEVLQAYCFQITPFLILITCILIIKSHIVIKVLVGLIASFAFTFITGMILVSQMCRYSTVRTLFINKESPTVKIILRDFGCGATDSSPATYHTFQTKNISPLLIYLKPIDTLTMNKKKWIRIKNEINNEE